MPPLYRRQRCFYPARMPASIDLDETLERLLTTLAPLADTVAHDPGLTVKPRQRHDSAAQRVQGLLGELGDAQALTAKLVLGDTLGRGGMGLVRLADQRSLGRKVAVKTLRPECVDEAATQNMMHEAWVTGALEHPNVVPIYDIGLDAEGRPLIVLKRIEGVTWSVLLLDDELVSVRVGGGDVLAWHLRVLMQVANAVAFAHERGIVHRDLKPDNVMIGDFGEVYLLDWGIAVSVEGDGGGRFPLAERSLELVGTPAYMAPEMANCQPVEPRTDVYLLGSLLYELLAGRAPHRGKTLLAILTSVLGSKPEIPDDAPPELAAICRRAMQAQPDDRYESATAFRDAIAAHLEHRGSDELAQKAEQSLQELRALLAAEGDAPRSERPAGQAGETEEDRRDQLYNLLGACRFGFRAALDAWPENTRAQSGLVEASEAMALYELQLGDPRAAAALVADLEAVPDALRAQIDAALRQRSEAERELADLAHVGRQMDRNIGRRTRALIAGIAGLVWAGVPLANWAFEALGISTYKWALFGLPIMALFFAGLGYWARESLMKTAVNRQLVALIALMFFGEGILLLLLWQAGISRAQSAIFVSFFWFVIAAVVTITVEWRMFPATLIYLATIGLVVAFPPWRHVPMSLANLGMAVNLVTVWWLLPRCQQDSEPATPQKSKT